jgi:hypothetical protein
MPIANLMPRSYRPASRLTQADHGSNPGRRATDTLRHQRQAGSLEITESLLDRERTAVSRAGRVQVAGDGVQNSVDRRGETLDPGEFGAAASLDAFARAGERRVEVEAEQAESPKECTEPISRSASSSAAMRYAWSHSWFACS